MYRYNLLIILGNINGQVADKHADKYEISELLDKLRLA